MLEYRSRHRTMLRTNVYGTDQYFARTILDTEARRRQTECIETIPKDRTNVKGKPMIVSKTVNLTRSEQEQTNQLLSLGSW